MKARAILLSLVCITQTIYCEAHVKKGSPENWCWHLFAILFAATAVGVVIISARHSTKRSIHMNNGSVVKWDYPDCAGQGRVLHTIPANTLITPEELSKIMGDTVTHFPEDHPLSKPQTMDQLVIRRLDKEDAFMVLPVNIVEEVASAY